MKMYPFSAQKHAHDIELVKNYAYNVANNAVDIGFVKEADKVFDLYNEACELLIAIQDGMQGYTGVTMLNGQMIGRAKEMVVMADNIRGLLEEVAKMTMKQRLEIIKEIERRNAERIKAWKESK